MSGHTYDQVSMAKRFASRRAAKRKSPVMRLNLTAMIDVIFLLLVYFVVTANFATGEGVLTTKMPPPGSADVSYPIDMPPMTPLRIYLHAQDQTGYRIRVVGASEQPANFTELAAVLTGLQRHGGQSEGPYAADDPVIIEPVGKVRWEHVLNAFNAAIKAKFKNVQFGAQAQ